MTKSRIPKILISVIALTIMFLYWSLFMPHYRYGSTSPDGEFRIEVYEEPKPFMTAPGDGGNRNCKLVLKNKWGIQISRSPTDEHFGLDYCDKEMANFEWDLPKTFVWYKCGDHIVAGFNLKTEKFEQ